MGNCSLKGVAGDFPNKIRLFTRSGDIIELKGPKLAKDVLSEFPGFGIFRQGNATTSSPLPTYEYLIGGQFYYLLPLEGMPIMLRDTGVANDQVCEMDFAKKENVGLTESPEMSSWKRLDLGKEKVNGPMPGPALQVLPSQRNGVWKVKLVINPKQLEEILSEEENTEALIEKMRMAAAANSASLAPRRSKSTWKPCLSNVFKVSPIDGAK
ncbi:hypothetical protein JCGZ_20436 [Jatropha curcas]|uniref:Uncharacterized protein n=1 Tax=Jatropha curcas TaxID=180498 RepID=A0A067JZ61_JATCU|nr:uncharacterized protein LOC105646027 [Jatropha curcas]KDP25280.1 hypothetical protein JCGZ_20436 [Jatropha curcas]